MTKRFYKVGIFLLIGAAVSVYGEEAPEAPMQIEVKKLFAPLDLFHCTLNLKSENQLRWYLFHRDGTVSATVGAKPGPLMSPLWKWMIHGQWMQISDGYGKVIFQMHPLKVSDKEMVIENGVGEKEVYEIERTDEPSPEGAPVQKHDGR